MKIAILSDIHGNHLALQAVLAEARKQGVERLLVLGDIVGYYYHPDKVLQLLEEWPFEMIRGNHEEMMHKARGDPQFSRKIQERYGSGIQIALQKLTPESVKLLTQLPNTKDLQYDNCKIRICHGSPGDTNEYVYTYSDQSILGRCAEGNFDFVFLGHTHHSFVHNCGSTTVVNPGSVGQARDISGYASWAILDTANRTLMIKHTPYDANPLVKEIQTVDPQVPYLVDVLRR